MKADDNQDDQREGQVATRKASEEKLEMAAGYNPGRLRAGECQGQAARRVVGSLHLGEMMGWPAVIGPERTPSS